MSGPKIDGDWKTFSSVYAKINGEWKIAAQTYSKIDGEWKETTLNSPPVKPTLEYHSTGKFRIVGYDSGLIYEPLLISGSGTANLDPVTGIFTLTNTNARFSVTSSYAPSSPKSDLSFVERKSYTEYTETYTFPTTCTGTRKVPYDCSYETVEDYYCCGAPCVVRYSGGQIVAYDCPPQDGWFCQINYLCCTYFCKRTVTVPKTCERDEDYTYDCTGTGTRPVRDETPLGLGYISSGTEWYKIS